VSRASESRPLRGHRVLKHHYYISDEDLLRVWVESATLEEVADMCGITVSTVLNRMTKMRNRGVEVPRWRDLQRQRLLVSLGATP